MDSYFSLDEAYGIHPYLDGLHSFKDQNTSKGHTETKYDYQTTTQITDGKDEYKFVHSHTDNHLHGRPFARVRDDCPRPNSFIDPNTGECTDQCRIDHDCALGYSCYKEKNKDTGYCLRETCSRDTDCSSKRCDVNDGKGLCKPIPCDQSYNQSSSLYAYDDFTKHFVPIESHNQGSCIATSHYHLQGRTATVNIQKDSRYKGMY